MNLSLRNIFYLFFIFAVISLVILSTCTLFFNAKLRQNQRYLQEINSIDTSRYTMGSTLRNALDNQITMLTNRKKENYTSLSSDAAQEKKFMGGLENLKKLVKYDPSLNDSINKIRTLYRQFVLSERALESVTLSSLIMKDELNKLNQSIYQEITDIQSSADYINGKLSLNNIRSTQIVNQYLKEDQLLATPVGRTAFKKATEKLLIGDLSDAEDLSTKLEINLAILSTLARQLSAESNSDLLSSLINNQIDQQINISKQNLKELKSKLKSEPELVERVSKMNGDFNSIVSKIIKSPDSMYALRQSLNSKEIDLQQSISQVKNSIYEINSELKKLDHIALALQNALLKKEEKTAVQIQSVIFGISGILALLMIAIGYYLLHIITNSLNTVTEGMKKVITGKNENSDINFDYRLEKNRFSELNSVGNAFNFMVGKLQFSHEHLAELVATKTKEVTSMFDELMRSSDGIIFLDNENKITTLNSTAAALFGVENNSDVIGKDITNYISDAWSNVIPKNMASFFTDHTEKTFIEVRIQNSKHTFCPAEISLSEINITDDLFSICIVRDIFNKKQSQLYLSVFEKLAKSSNIEITMPKILSVLCDTLSLETGGLWMPHESVLQCSAFFSQHDEKIGIHDFIEKSKAWSFEKGIGLPGRVWKNKTVEWIKDVVTDPNFPRAEIASKANLHAAFAFPIQFKGEVIAVLEFFMQHAYCFDDQWVKTLNNIGNQIGIFIENERTWKAVTDLQRQAGMAEVAASTLHNIGNVLNSAGVSISMLNDTLRKSTFERVSRTVDLLKEHETQLQSYLTQDPKGKLLPEYFIQLLDEIGLARDELKMESQKLSMHFNHIKEIVAMQGAISGRKANVMEKVFISEIIDMVVSLSAQGLESKNIRLEKKIDNFAFVVADKSRLIQILVNLIQNAKDAFIDMDQDKLKIISINVNVNEEQHYFEIIIQDNGIGITAENLAKLFRFGFTTKEKGHGFGLHNSSLSAKELGGTLTVKSEGEGKGAIFILTLPLESSDKTDGVAHEEQ